MAAPWRNAEVKESEVLGPKTDPSCINTLLSAHSRLTSTRYIFWVREFFCPEPNITE